MIGIHDNEIIIVPEIKINQNEMHEIYAISRDSLEIKTIPNNSFLDNHINWIKFQYILGTYLINKIYYFVFVEQSKLIYPQLDIYQISSINIIQITPGDENHHVIEMIRHAFSFNNIYYSSKYNLYNSFSVKFNNNREIFIWNHLAIELSKQVFHHKLDNLLLPVINGSVSFFDNFCLISRRSFIQCSVRFWIRGADKDGNSANFIETEEVVIINDKEIKSFIQIRGSIPVHWTEYPNLTFLPKIIVDERNESFERCRKHFKLLSNLYDKVKVINLTSEKGRETQLTELYKKCCKKLEIEYHHIDTEQLCGVFHWNKLGLEINKIEIGFPNFSLIKDGITNIAQEYVIRTNCADSIDRTNVIQCEIGLKVYLEMIHHSKKEFEYKSTEFKLRKCWYENGNNLAKQIVGSHALKGDITMNKHRTVSGLIKDGITSLVRYYYDNFQNGTRQDSLDCVILTRNITISNTIKRPPFSRLLILFQLLLLNLVYWISRDSEKQRENFESIQNLMINAPTYREIEKL